MSESKTIERAEPAGGARMNEQSRLVAAIEEAQSAVIPNWKRKLGCSNGSVSCSHGLFHFHKLSHRLAWKLWCLWDRMAECPRILRWSLANTLSRWAIKLRGQRVFETAIGVVGNESADLADSIRIKIVTEFRDQGDLEEYLPKLERLEQMAKATWYHAKGAQ